VVLAAIPSLSEKAQSEVHDVLVNGSVGSFWAAPLRVMQFKVMRAGSAGAKISARSRPFRQQCAPTPDNTD